jgi:hypothetical protein
MRGLDAHLPIDRAGLAQRARAAAAQKALGVGEDLADGGSARKRASITPSVRWSATLPLSPSEMAA